MTIMFTPRNQRFDNAAEESYEEMGGRYHAPSSSSNSGIDISEE